MHELQAGFVYSQIWKRFQTRKTPASSLFLIRSFSRPLILSLYTSGCYKLTYTSQGVECYHSNPITLI